MTEETKKTGADESGVPQKEEKNKNASGEKNYKTAFFLMSGVVMLLFFTLIGILYIQHKSVQQIAFYAEDDIRAVTNAGEDVTADLKVNINTADIYELTLLPGIGESRANDIITYRNEYGKFTSPEDLLNIDGIGEATLEKLRPYIVFEDAD